MDEAPTLTTARLRLRAHRADDLDACAALWGDAEVVRYMGGAPIAREEVWARILRYAGHWKWLGYGFWAIEDARGAYIGEGGFAEFERAIEPALNAPEMAWAFAQRAWGQGYAGEAVAAMAAWGDARGWARTQAIINPGNAASMRVAARAGFAPTHDARYRGGVIGVYERRRDA